jgi:hypothetical protein
MRNNTSKNMGLVLYIKYVLYVICSALSIMLEIYIVTMLILKYAKVVYLPLKDTNNIL